ncbi:hypothetical protein G6F65_021360 [Rhizopus arrhizus]|nr:hypothetical protein G6F68_021453 [Rhizopus microsporus]KAG1245204.1 hypothetical protein G6F65_021360 [Rhizopus arrhizus]KAG1477899.1 hypothetical protein G6F54_014036 [Rhizopus delemar]
MATSARRGAAGAAHDAKKAPNVSPMSLVVFKLLDCSAELHRRIGEVGLVGPYATKRVNDRLDRASLFMGHRVEEPARDAIQAGGSA